MKDHAKAAERLLEHITIDPNDPEFTLAVAQVHALLALREAVEELSRTVWKK